jgi:HlyD family secretion protein
MLTSCEKQNSYNTTGYVDANLVYISISTGGYLQELSVEEGQKIKKGQQLLKLNAEPIMKDSKWSSNTKKLFSPNNAEISTIYFEEGEYIPPARPILSLFVSEKSKIIFFVDETALNKITLNKKIHIILGNNTSYDTKVTYISKQAEYTSEPLFSEKSKHKLVYKIKAEVTPNLHDILKPGQPVDINYE